MSRQEVVEHLIKHNANNYNLRKLLEEGIELNEVIIKMLNKSEENKPPVEKLIEEAGDVIFRLGVILRQYNIKEAVINRAMDKGNQIKETIMNGKFKGGQ